MPTLKHFPDKPWERHPKDIPSWDDGQHICQQKCDGWRVEVCKDLKGNIHYLSRHNKSLDNDIEPEIKVQIELLFQHIPNSSQLDGEWLSRREATNKKTKPYVIFFDVIRCNSEWLLQTPYEHRWNLLQDVFTKMDLNLLPNVSLSETAKDNHFVEFYEAQKTITYSEGIVIKHRQSTLIGDRKESKKNQKWMKIKYRGCSSGQELLEHLR